MAQSCTAHNPRWQPSDRARARPCAAMGCQEKGQYPAPKSRDDLREYQWFCLDHVREFNSSWNFLDGMNAAQIEEFIRASTVGERPTRPLSGEQAKAYEAILRTRIFKEFGAGGVPTPDADTAALLAGFSHEEIKACRVLTLNPTRDFKMIKARYRQLVKKLHPDVNDQNVVAQEEKLKVINQAYTVLKSAAHAAN